MPSYLSSTQTSGPSRATISAASSAGDASMNLSGWNRASEALARASSRARAASCPTSPTSIPAHLTSSSGRSKARAMAASTRPSRSPIRSSPPSTLTMYLAVSGSARSSRSRRMADLRAGPDACSIAANAAATSGSVGLTSGRRFVAGLAQHIGDGDAEVGRAVVGLAERRAGHVSERGHGRGDGRPAETGRPLVGLGERPAGQEDGRDRQLGGRQLAQVVGEDRRLLGGPGRRREALGELAPATHRTMVYRAEDGAADVVPRDPDRHSGRPAPPRPGEHRRVPALVRRPGDRPAGALPGHPDAPRGDRALLRGPGRRARRAGDGGPRADDRPARRDLRLQPARRRERVRAVPHHDRRDGRVGPRLRHRGDAADARPRVRHARACTGSPCSCSSSTSARSAPIAAAGS